MGRSGPRVDSKVTTSTLLNSALAIKGPLRIRPYGNVKHAHVILRKVDEEEYEDEGGQKRTRGVFSLFAHKLINVKPGKELFLYLHPVGGELEERVVAFEADLLLENEKIEEEPAKTEETAVQSQSEHILPPKMRKQQWMRRVSMPSQSSANTVVAPPLKVSIGVQVEPQVTTNGTQTTAQKRQSSPEETFAQLPEKEARKADIISAADLQRSAMPSGDAAAALPVIEGKVEDRDSCDSASETRVSSALTNAAERTSLTPMEIDSPATTPAYTPELLPTELPSAIVKEEPIEWSLSQLETTMKPLPPLNTPSHEQKTANDSQLTSAVTLVDSHHTDDEIGSEAYKERLYKTPSFASSTSTSIVMPTPLSMLAISRPGPRPQPNIETPMRSIPLLTEQKLKSITDLANALSMAKAHSSPTDTNEPPIRSQPIVSNSTPSSSKVTLDQAFPSDASIASTPTSLHGRSPAMQRPLSIPIPSTEQSRSSTPSHKPRFNSKFSKAPVFVPASQPFMTMPTTSPASLKRPRSPSSSGATPFEETPTQRNKRHCDVVKMEPKSPVLNAFTEFNGDARSMSMSSLTPTGTSTQANTPVNAYGRNNWSRLPPQASVTPYSTVTVKTEPSESYPLAFRNTSPSLRTYPTYDVFDLTPAEGYIRRTGIDLTLPSKPHAGNQRRGPRPSYVSGLRQLRTAEIKMRKDCGVRSIVFNQTGKLFAVICRDNTVRIWDNTTYTEIAKLAHSSIVHSVVWLNGETAVASLGANGIVSKWTMLGENRWNWEKLVDSGDNDPTCLAYHSDRLAVSNPRRGITVWLLDRGRWRVHDRQITRRDVLFIQFIDNGDNLLCGATDGSVFYCEIPSMKMTNVASFKTKVFQLNIDHNRRFALVAQASNRAHLIDIDTSDSRTLGRTIQDFSLRDAEYYPGRPTNAFGAVFANRGECIIFGSVGGTVLLWDKRSGKITHELDHGSDALVQALASYDENVGGKHIVSGTRSGLLHWWAFPWDAR